MSELWAGEEPSVVPSASLLLLRLAGCHGAGVRQGSAPWRGTTGHLEEGSQGWHMDTGDQEKRAEVEGRNVECTKCSPMELHCRGWRGWMWCEESLSAKAYSVCLLASGLWNILLSLDKALKYSCSFIIKLLFKLMVECGYNFKQGTMLVYFQSAAHKPNSCSRTCWARAWTSKCILLIIGSNPAEDLVP